MIPRPIESAPAVHSQPNAIEWPVEAGEDGDRARSEARGSRRNRVKHYGRTEEHQPDLSTLKHVFDESMHCEGCGKEYLAVCAWRPVCGED